jgi:hypothetical protein
MELSPSCEANSRSASQIAHILWNPNVYYRFHKNPPLVPISQMNPVHSLQNYFKINSTVTTTKNYIFSQFLLACPVYLFKTFNLPRIGSAHYQADNILHCVLQIIPSLTKRETSITMTILIYGKHRSHLFRGTDYTNNAFTKQRHREAMPIIVLFTCYITQTINFHFTSILNTHLCWR